MKMRKLFSFLLALLTALAAVLPARAAEGPGQVQDPASVPEESPAENETAPDWLLEPEDVEQTPEPPADTAAPEDPVVPETPENPEIPGEILPPAEPETPETPETPEEPVVPEEPDQPVEPEIPEAPVIPEVPEMPETPVNPDDPSQPPAWLLPGGELPALPAPLPGAEDPALLPPENAAAEEPPVINVLVPSTGQIVINPYRLPVELDGQTSNDQIVSEQLILQNLSVVPVSVSASVTGTVPPGSGVSFVAASPMPDSPVKEVFLFAEFQPLPDPVLQPAWNVQYSDSTNQLLVAGFQSTAKDNVLRLEAGGFGAMRLFGSAAVSPVNPWQAGDDIQASFVFSFTPIVDAAETYAADDFAADTPVVDAPVVETPATETPAADVPAFDELSDGNADALPSWLFES